MSEQPKHTTGDWLVKCGKSGGYEEWFIHRDGGIVAIASDIRDPLTGLPSKEIARQLAAAPELLDALRAAMEHIPETLQTRARDAIAKAEGRGE